MTASDRVRFATSDIGEIVWCWSLRSAKVRNCVGLDRNTAQSGEQSSLAAYNLFRNISLASDAVLEGCFCVRRTAGSGLLIVSWRVFVPSSVAAHIPTFAAQESAPANHSDREPTFHVSATQTYQTIQEGLEKSIVSITFLGLFLPSTPNPPGNNNSQRPSSTFLTLETTNPEQSFQSGDTTSASPLKLVDPVVRFQRVNTNMIFSQLAILTPTRLGVPASFPHVHHHSGRPCAK